MSKRILTVVASGLLLATSAAFAADGYSAAQSGSLWRAPAPPVQTPEQGAAGTGAARRFYSYQPPAARGQRYVLTPFVRPASAKPLGNY
jgi:hypothetical protein